MKLTADGLTDNSGKVLVDGAGSQINATVITFTGETAVSGAANGTVFSSSFTKIGGTETNVIVMARINGSGRSAGVCGAYIEVGGSRSYVFNYVYDNWSSGDQCYQGTEVFTGLTAGSKTVTVGWSTNDGAGGNKPFDYANPGGGRTDSRHRAQNSYIAIWEYRA